jgi:hypothetical protein
MPFFGSIIQKRTVLYSPRAVVPLLEGCDRCFIVYCDIIVAMTPPFRQRSDRSLSQTNMKKYLLIFVFVLTPLFGYLFWHASTPTLETDLSKYQKAGDEVKQSLSSLPALPITEDDRHYTIEDTRKDGIQITYANQTDTALAATPEQEKLQDQQESSR